MAFVDRRIGLLFGGFLLLLLIAAGRTAYLGVFQSGALSAAADSQQLTITPIPAQRGQITDRNGQVLAISEAADEVVADPYLIAQDRNAVKGQTPSVIAAELAPLVGMSESAVFNKLTATSSGELAGYSPIAYDVPAAQGTDITNLRIDGINETPVEDRVYPRGSEAAQVLGFVNGRGQGGDGIEYLFNNVLGGRSGVERVVSDAQGKAISVTAPQPMVAGQNIALTISSPLQQEVESVVAQLGAQYSPHGVSAIVTDPQTDQILALANWPFVNSNNVAASSPASLEDQAVDLSYEPGSTYKAITVAGALQDGDVAPSTVITIPPYLHIDGKTITDAESHGYINYTVAQVLKYSSNIGADLIANRMGMYSFASWVTKFGFGRPTGVALPGEQQGVILPVRDYSPVSMWNLPFGQGQEVTPMQMVQAYDAIANGGILRTPQIIQSIGGRTQSMPKGQRILSPAVALELREMLRGVLADGGTASGAAINGYDLAGKTGTAQVVVNGKYSNTLFDSSFIGMVPASNPKLVIAIVVDRTPEYGATIAAPAFQKIVGWAVPYLGINPCPSPCPASAYDSGSTP
jgi:cell division protein FtsI/penicillin-binding protein 2